MAQPLIVDVLCRHRTVYSEPLAQPLELGRLKGDEPATRVGLNQPRGDAARVAIVEAGETSVSRDHARIERIADNRIRITNISTNNFLRFDSETLTAGQSRELDVPTRFFVGPAEVRVEVQPELRSLTPTARLSTPSQGLVRGAVAAAFLELPDEQAAPLADWLDSIVRVLQSAVSSTDFYQNATEAMVKLIGLDAGQVLMRVGSSWRQMAFHAAENVPEEKCESQPSTQILAALVRDKQTVWGDPGQACWDTKASLVGVQAVVAAPIVDGQGDVIGALYGDRLSGAGGRSKRPQITNVEAMMVKILAGSVAAGLARVEQEQAAKQQREEAAAARTLFGQFFTPELSERLAADPDMLKGRDTEVTLLFCDIRNFSGISQQLEPAVTMDWIGDVIGALSDCVIEHQGVLVDYVGDELLAMWGAPSEQVDQAILACQAALAMHDSLPALNQRWQARMGAPLRIGVGINTGMARVGNIGSQRKLKYGPLGNTVNLASRVQGLSKFLKTEILISAATRSRLTSEFFTRRLGKVRVVNIKESVELYELRPEADAPWHTLRLGYEQALDDFERQNFEQAAAALRRITAQFADDGATQILCSRTDGLVSAGAGFNPAWDPAWVPPGK